MTQRSGLSGWRRWTNEWMDKCLVFLAILCALLAYHVFSAFLLWLTGKAIDCSGRRSKARLSLCGTGPIRCSERISRRTILNSLNEMEDRWHAGALVNAGASQQESGGFGRRRGNPTGWCLHRFPSVCVGSRQVLQLPKTCMWGNLGTPNWLYVWVWMGVGLSMWPCNPLSSSSRPRQHRLWKNGGAESITTKLNLNAIKMVIAHEKYMIQIYFAFRYCSYIQDSHTLIPGQL